MNREEITAYLAMLGFTQILQTRVAEIEDFYTGTFPWVIQDAFVSEYMKEDGERVFESLWFFAEGYAMEAHDFLTLDRFDIAPINLRHLVVTKTEYNYKEANPKSRLNIQGVAGLGTTYVLKASGSNCDYLRKIVAKHFVPQILKPEGPSAAMAEADDDGNG